MSSTPRQRSLSNVLFAALVIAILLAILFVAFAAGLNPASAVTRVVDSFFPPVAVTDQGASIRQLYDIVFLIAVAIFFVVEGLILWTVLRYRRRPGDDELPPQTHGNALAEALWTIIPTVIVAFLFVISWQTLNTVEAVSAEPQLRVRALAAQFQWQFDYYDESGENIVYTQLVPAGEGGGMAVPVGEDINLVLESRDVIHAYYVPHFLFKRDVVPGRISEFTFRVKPEDANKTFGGQCAELCGSGHRLMTFEVHSMTRADFDAWLQDHIDQATANPPPPPSGEPGGSGPPPSAAPNPSQGANTVIQIAAQNIAFDTAELEVAGDTPFQIEFDNLDSLPHNVAIHQGSPTGPSVFQGEIVTGPTKVTYDVPPLPAGAYAFVCTVHPQMTGTLNAE
jgi:cytochrome c oxidase subunit II